jgi:hypothetical protein
MLIKPISGCHYWCAWSAADIIEEVDLSGPSLAALREERGEDDDEDGVAEDGTDGEMADESVEERDLEGDELDEEEPPKEPKGADNSVLVRKFGLLCMQQRYGGAFSA